MTIKNPRLSLKANRRVGIKGLSSVLRFLVAGVCVVQLTGQLRLRLMGRFLVD